MKASIILDVTKLSSSSNKGVCQRRLRFVTLEKIWLYKKDTHRYQLWIQRSFHHLENSVSLWLSCLESKKPLQLSCFRSWRSKFLTPINFGSSEYFTRLEVMQRTKRDTPLILYVSDTKTFARLITRLSSKHLAHNHL